MHALADQRRAPFLAMPVGTLCRVLLWFKRQSIAFTLAELVEIELGHDRLQPNDLGFKRLIGCGNPKLFALLFRPHDHFHEGNRLA